MSTLKYLLCWMDFFPYQLQVISITRGFIQNESFLYNLNVSDFSRPGYKMDPGTNHDASRVWLQIPIRNWRKLK